MAKLATLPIIYATDNNGLPLNGGKLYTYEAGTTTFKTTYTDALEGTANSNPVILDASGRANVWYGDGAYKIVMKTSADVTLWTVDNLSGDSANAFGASYTKQSTNLSVTTAFANGVIDCDATLVLSLPAVAVAKQGFYINVRNSSASGTVTIDPNAAELINGASTIALTVGQSALVICTGTAWVTLFYTANETIAAAAIADNRIVRGDGGARGLQQSVVTLSDAGDMTGLTGLEVIESSVSGSGEVGGTVARFERNSDVAIQINGNSSNSSTIWFGNNIAPNAFKLQYLNGASSFNLGTGSANRFNIDSSGAIQTGAASAAAGYTSAGDITLPTTGKVRAANTASFYANFNGTGTVAIRNSFNVSSVTDNGVGRWTVNLTNALPSTNASVFCGGLFASATTNASDFVSYKVSSTTTVDVFSATISGANTDLEFVNVIGFGG